MGTDKHVRKFEQVRRQWFKWTVGRRGLVWAVLLGVIEWLFIDWLLEWAEGMKPEVTGSAHAAVEMVGATSDIVATWAPLVVAIAILLPQLRAWRPTLYVSGGLLGTFIGLVSALRVLEPESQNALASVMAATSFAFSTSVVGLAASLVASTLNRLWFEGKDEDTVVGAAEALRASSEQTQEDVRRVLEETAHKLRMESDEAARENAEAMRLARDSLADATRLLHKATGEFTRAATHVDSAAEKWTTLVDGLLRQFSAVEAEANKVIQSLTTRLEAAYDKVVGGIREELGGLRDEVRNVRGALIELASRASASSSNLVQFQSIAHELTRLSDELAESLKLQREDIQQAHERQADGLESLQVRLGELDSNMSELSSTLAEARKNIDALQQLEISLEVPMQRLIKQLDLGISEVTTAAKEKIKLVHDQQKQVEGRMFDVGAIIAAASTAHLRETGAQLDALRDVVQQSVSRMNELAANTEVQHKKLSEMDSAVASVRKVLDPGNNSEQAPWGELAELKQAVRDAISLGNSLKATFDGALERPSQLASLLEGSKDTEVGGVESLEVYPARGAPQLSQGEGTAEAAAPPLASASPFDRMQAGEPRHRTARDPGNGQADGVVHGQPSHEPEVLT